MELHISFLAILLLFVLMVIKTIKKPKPTNLPPSPWKLPIIGNLHQLAKPGSLPHSTLRDLAMKHGPLMHLQLGEVPTVVISSPETAKEVLTTHDINFSNRPHLLAAKVLSYNFTNIIVSPYGAYWRQLRRICTTKLLSPSRVQSFRSIREEEVSKLMRTIASCQGSRVNLSNMIFSLTYGITSRAAFGEVCKDQERFLSNISKSKELAGGFCLADMYPSIKVLEMVSGSRRKLEKVHRENDEILENIINQHREGKTRTSNGDGETDEKDLVDVLLELQANGDLDSSLTDNNIKAVIMDVFAAGSETSSTTIEWAMSEMMKNPGLMKKAQVEVRQVFRENGGVIETDMHKLEFLKALVKETLRLHPSAPLLIPRECGEDCVINGYNIPAKARVVVNAWALGRDPGYWNEPNRFNPQRFLDNSVDYKGAHFQFILFGAGRRMCPGISYALPNIELPLAKLLYHFDWKLPDGKSLKDLDMKEAFGLTVSRKESLFLIPIVYRH